MFGWAATFLVLALVALYLGFFALIGLAAILAKVFLLIFLVLMVVSVLPSIWGGRRGT